jgi:hypothetical protein
MVVNAGMSATNSMLGVFRLRRDVIDYQPDLVAIEYCVNDGRTSDADTIRYMESIIVRLKSLSDPPAIIILEAAMQNGVNLDRHRELARHYGLVEVDLQQATDEYLARNGKPWSDLFKDGGHPNEAGHAFYSEAIADVLEPYLDRPAPRKMPQLPAPLSKRPLILDGRMVDLSTVVAASGWELTPSFPNWWGRFFSGALSSNQPGAVLRLNVHGSFLGLYYALAPDNGAFYVSVDDGFPILCVANSRNGYDFELYARDLPLGDHSLSVVLPSRQDPVLKLNGPVHLGYLLVAGDKSETSSEVPGKGMYSPARLAELRFTTLSPEQFQWAGPYWPSGLTARNAQDVMDTVFAPEVNPSVVKWKEPEKIDGNALDFRVLTGLDSPTVNYAKCKINSPQYQSIMLAVTVDYFVSIWLNEELVATLDRPRGPSAQPVLFPVELKKGENDLLVKVGAGSKGNRLSISLVAPE